MGNPVTYKEANQMIKEADLNGDGLINYQEFYAKMTAKENDEGSGPSSKGSSSRYKEKKN